MISRENLNQLSKREIDFIKDSDFKEGETMKKTPEEVKVETRANKTDLIIKGLTLENIMLQDRERATVGKLKELDFEYKRKYIALLRKILDITFEMMGEINK